MKCVIKILKDLVCIFSLCLGLGYVVGTIEKRQGKVGWVVEHKPYSFYEKNVKRPLDFGLSLFALLFLWPVMAGTAMLVRLKLGKPVLFKQQRPGLGEEIFTIRKFRTMQDGDGKDEERLTDFGKKLRSTSIDELPELFNILDGSMSVVGPRPQLIRDMVFMSEEHRKRHDVRAGLTGLAQVNGRNGISWENKLDADLQYVDSIKFRGDLRIVLQTVKKVLTKDGINEDGHATALDYGDWLLVDSKVSQVEYVKKQREAEELLNEAYKKNL